MSVTFKDANGNPLPDDVLPGAGNRTAEEPEDHSKYAASVEKMIESDRRARDRWLAREEAKEADHDRLIRVEDMLLKTQSMTRAIAAHLNIDIDEGEEE